MDDVSGRWREDTCNTAQSPPLILSGKEEDDVDNEDEDGRCLRKMQKGDILDAIFSFNGGVAQQTGFHFLIKRRTALLACLEQLEVLLCAMKK